ncbi:MAG: hypothetical protein QXZ10_01040, partial [Sulfolobales archaeon]
MMVDPLTAMLRQLPKSALIVIIGNPYTYSFHIGLELIKRAYLNFRWYLFINDVTQRYAEIIRQYGIIKSDINFINDLCRGAITLDDVLRVDGNLAYVVINSDSSCIDDYNKVLSKRDPSVESTVVIQIDEAYYKSIAYLADLIIKLGIVEDAYSFKTISRLAKLTLVRGGATELSVSYSIMPNEVLFKE